MWTPWINLQLDMVEDMDKSAAGHGRKTKPDMHKHHFIIPSQTWGTFIYSKAKDVLLTPVQISSNTARLPCHKCPNQNTSAKVKCENEYQPRPDVLKPIIASQTCTIPIQFPHKWLNKIWRWWLILDIQYGRKNRKAVIDEGQRQGTMIVIQVVVESNCSK